MHPYIQKLQSKSEDARKQILVGTLVVSMTIVGAVWVYGLGYHFNSDTAAQAETDIKPFALFGESVSNAWNGITASVGTVSNKTPTTETPEKPVDVVSPHTTN